jgi:hypothetical protein
MYLSCDFELLVISQVGIEIGILSIVLLSLWLLYCRLLILIALS